MSPIGKVFVVLNLVLAAAFLGWAANALSTTQQWKDEYEKEVKARAADVAAKDDEISKLGVEVKSVTEQQRQFHSERDQKSAEADGLRRELEELTSRHDALSASLKKIESTLGDYNNTITQIGQQKDAAIKESHEAQRERDGAVAAKDAAEMAQRDAEEAQKNAEMKIGNLEKERVALLDQLSTLETQISVIVAATNYDRSITEAAPKIDSYVLDVNRDLKLVVINKGSKDQVKTGYTFSVYRGSQFKGQVRIQDVQEGMASGIIINEKSPITRGDSASTGI
jgi:chromosome segregation ATPase